jgi:hypothetical protein
MSFIGLLLELLINISQDYRKDLSYVGRELLYGAIRKVSYRVSDSSCHPPKNRVPDKGGVLGLCFFPSPHVWDSVFLGGGKKNRTPCTYGARTKLWTVNKL